MRSSLFNLLYPEVDQSPVVPMFTLELKVLKMLLTFSQTPNVDLVEMPKLSKQTTSLAQRDQILSTKLNIWPPKITPVSYANLLIQTTKLKLLL